MSQDAGLTGNVADAAAGGDSGSGDGTTFNFDQSQSQQQAEPTINPAWKDMLDSLPTQLHQSVIPHLSKWDKGVQERFTTVQQQYEPWKPFIDEGIDPDVIRGLTNLIENDPSRLVQELVQFHGLDPKTLFQDQGQGQQSDSDSFDLDQIQDPQQFDLTKIPEFQQLQLQNQQLMQAWEGNAQQQLAQQAQAEVQTEIEQVKAANPDIVEPILLALAMSLNMSVTDAAKKYDELMPKAPRNAPTVLSPTGGIPQAAGVKPHDMTSQQRTNLVKQILEANASSD